jgi:hypothetical protein
MRDRYAIAFWLVVQCTACMSACAHRQRTRAIDSISRSCDLELRAVASTAPLEGLGARLDAIQARCDAAAEEIGR